MTSSQDTSNLSHITPIDRALMASAIRFSRRNMGQTGTNPAVGTLIVRFENDEALIVGRGVTALGGRPHAETQALAQAGDLAHGACAYVTLEPCAHHGKTPPCATALINAGIKRVIGAANDPDSRVAGKGYGMLREAGIVVVENVLAHSARAVMSGYLSRSSKMRPTVTLKLAVSANEMIGQQGQGQIAITGNISRAQTHIMRAEHDAILIGVGTAIADDPKLDCRLPGLSHRSPIAIVLDPTARMPLTSNLVEMATKRAIIIIHSQRADSASLKALQAKGVTLMPCEEVAGKFALPELLEDIAARGISSIMVEGGAGAANAFLDDALVDRICLFKGPDVIEGDGIVSPLTSNYLSSAFSQTRKASYGKDQYCEWKRVK